MLTTNSSLMDGINRHILAVSQGLKAKGVEVAVCTVHPEGELAAELDAHDIRCYSLGCTHGHAWRIVTRYRRVIKDFKPDIVHIHVMALFERLANGLFFRKMPHVITVHGVSDELLENSVGGTKAAKSKGLRINPHKTLENFIMRHCKVDVREWIFISRGTAGILSPAFENNPRCHVVYNPIDLANVPQKRHKIHSMLNVGNDTPIIGTCCRVAKVKRPELFTDAMCRVLKHNPEAHAVVIGGGEQQIIDKCNDIVTEYGVSEQFHWLGYQKDAPQLVADLNCFVMTSSWEGLPTSVLEAIAANVPVAMLRGRGGLEDIALLNAAEGPFALIGEDNDLAQFGCQIGSLLSDRIMQQEFTAEARRMAEKHFSLEKVCSQLAEIYNNVTG